eukprot:scaffold73947_cov39-Tisochrysis_lutea.AAC.2
MGWRSESGAAERQRASQDEMSQGQIRLSTVTAACPRRLPTRGLNVSRSSADGGARPSTEEGCVDSARM